jgi:hypothetical protein
MCPSIGGGRQWNHGSYSPRTGWFYTTGIEWCQEITVMPEKPKEGVNFFGGVFGLKPPLRGTVGGHLDAYDPVTGKKFWSYPWKYPLLASRRFGFYRRSGRKFLRLGCRHRKKALELSNGLRTPWLVHHIFRERPPICRDALGLGIVTCGPVAAGVA